MKLPVIIDDITKHLKMVFPSLVMFGVLPQYFLVWVAWKVVSSVLPSWVFQAGDDLYYSMYQRLVLFFFEHISGTQVILHGNVAEVLSKKERVIYLSNHQSTVDWVVVHILADRQGSIGHVRYVMKDSLQLLPFYGFYFYQHGCVFVKRKFFNGNRMMSALKYLQNKKIFSWMVIFPEGTRYNPESTKLIEDSKKYSIDQGLAPMNHVLSPKYRGLQLLLDSLRNNLDAIYDVTVIYSCTKGNKKGFRTKAPTMFEFVTGCCDTIHIHVNRVSIKNVPTDEQELKHWLYRCFQEKERILEGYYNDTSFPSNGHPLSNGMKSAPNFIRNFGSFVFFASLSIPFAITSFGRSMYWKTWLYGSFFGYFWLGIHSLC